jgi:hypothetical protein
MRNEAGKTEGSSSTVKFLGKYLKRIILIAENIGKRFFANHAMLLPNTVMIFVNYSGFKAVSNTVTNLRSAMTRTMISQKVKEDCVGLYSMQI